MAPRQNDQEVRQERREAQSNPVLNQLLGSESLVAVAPERRRIPERRRLTLRSVAYGGFRPRRRRLRRVNDCTLPVVDWHEPHLLVISVLVLIFSCADAFLTLELLVLGAQEVNPVMARLIDADAMIFTAVKLALTGAGLVVIVLLARYRLFGRFPVVKTLYAVLIGYASLVLYQLAMLGHLMSSPPAG